MIVTVTLNPCIDRTLFLDGLKPNDTNRVQRTEIDSGGKGINVSRVAHRLDAKTMALGLLGGGAGASIVRQLDREAVPNDFTDIQGETRINISVEDGSGRPPTSLNERGPNIHEHEWNSLTAVMGDYLQRASWLVLAGSIPPGLPEDAYRILANLARGYDCRVAVDADGDALLLGMMATPNFIKPNRREAARLLRREIETDEDAQEAARTLRKRLQPDGWAVVSLGAQGAALATRDGVYWGSAIPVQQQSTIGSGDSMVAGMLAHFDEGPEAALAWGLAAGAATAESGGSDIGRGDAVYRLRGQAQVRRV